MQKTKSKIRHLPTERDARNHVASFWRGSVCRMDSADRNVREISVAVQPPHVLNHRAVNPPNNESLNHNSSTPATLNRLFVSQEGFSCRCRWGSS